MLIEEGNHSDAQRILYEARLVVDVQRRNTKHLSAGPIHVGDFLRRFFHQELVCEQSEQHACFFVGDEELKPDVLAVNLLHDAASNCFKHAGKEAVHVELLQNMLRISNKVSSGLPISYSSSSGLLAMQAEAEALGVPCQFDARDGRFVVEFSLQCRLTAPQSVSQVPTQQTVESDPYGTEEFSWVLVEDDPIITRLFTPLMARVGIKHHSVVQTADEVQAFVETTVSHASSALSLNLKTICLMDENLMCCDGDGQHVKTTGTELRKQLQENLMARQFIAEGSLLLMSMSGSKAVEDSSLVLVIQKGASATATTLRQAVAAARALAVEISLMPKLGT